MAARRLTGKDLPALRSKLALSQLQLGELARATIATRPSPSGGIDRQCSTVQRWEDGSRVLSAPVAELIEAKLSLLEARLATFDELVDMSLAQVIARLTRGARPMSARL